MTVYIAGIIGDEVPVCATRSLEVAMLLVFRPYVLSCVDPPTPTWTCRFVDDEFGDLACETTWTDHRGRERRFYIRSLDLSTSDEALAWWNDQVTRADAGV